MLATNVSPLRGVSGDPEPAYVHNPQIRSPIGLGIFESTQSSVILGCAPVLIHGQIPGFICLWYHMIIPCQIPVIHLSIKFVRDRVIICVVVHLKVERYMLVT